MSVQNVIHNLRDSVLEINLSAASSMREKVLAIKELSDNLTTDNREVSEQQFRNLVLSLSEDVNMLLVQLEHARDTIRDVRRVSIVNKNRLKELVETTARAIKIYQENMLNALSRLDVALNPVRDAIASETRQNFES